MKAIDMPNDNTDLKRFPPIPPEELEGAHEYTEIERVVVTRSGVFGLAIGGGWVHFERFWGFAFVALGLMIFR